MSYHVKGENQIRECDITEWPRCLCHEYAEQIAAVARQGSIADGQYSAMSSA
jgi:hypothetical protein